MSSIYLVVYDCPRDTELSVAPFNYVEDARTYFHNLSRNTADNLVYNLCEVDVEHRTSTEDFIMVDGEYGITISLTVAKMGVAKDLY